MRTYFETMLKRKPLFRLSILNVLYMLIPSASSSMCLAPSANTSRGGASASLLLLLLLLLLRLLRLLLLLLIMIITNIGTNWGTATSADFTGVSHSTWAYLQEGTRNQTERAEPNWTKPFNSGTGLNRTRKRTEPNRWGRTPWGGKGIQTTRGKLI